MKLQFFVVRANVILVASPTVCLLEPFYCVIRLQRVHWFVKLPLVRVGIVCGVVQIDRRAFDEFNSVFDASKGH